MIWILIFFIGVIASTLGSLVGLGGAFIIVPALLFLGQDVHWISNITPQTAAGTSLIALIFTGLSSSIAYWKKKTIDVKSALIFFIGIAPGSVLGSLTNEGVTAKSFNLYLGIWMILMSILLVLRNYLKPAQFTGTNKMIRTWEDSKGEVHTYGYTVWVAIAISVVVGFFSGFFGIGGGALMVPAMLLVFRFPTHVAVGTSMLVILLSTLAGSVSHISLGNVIWVYAFALIPGSFIGGKIGSYISLRLKGNTVVVILRVLLILIGLKMIIESFLM